MSVLRQGNWLGQQRIDVAHLRALESSIVADFDLLAGTIVAGQRGFVVRGLTIPFKGIGVLPADRLVLRVGGAVTVHPTASEKASIFTISDNEPEQVLNTSNEKVEGAFLANSTNYIGIDISRVTDPESYDTVKFLDADTEQEIPKTVPLSRVLDYRIVISPQGFSVRPQILPIARVKTDAVGTVVEIADCRPLLFRLGSGGDVPNAQNRFYWSERHKGSVASSSNDVDPFVSGDKQITSQKQWMDAVMTRLWELGGGPYWFSPSSDRDIKTAYGPVVNPNWGNVSLDDGNLKWQSISVLFANSPASLNVVADELEGVLFPDGSCLYVDIDRNVEQTVFARVGKITDIGTPLIPGSRIILAWRIGDNIFLRDAPYENGRVVPTATSGSDGVVRLYQEALNPANPSVLPDSILSKINNPSHRVAVVLGDLVDHEGSAGGWSLGGHLIPRLANLDIGSTSDRWRHGYFDSVTAGSEITPIANNSGSIGKSNQRFNEGWFKNLEAESVSGARFSSLVPASPDAEVGSSMQFWRNGFFQTLHANEIGQNLVPAAASLDVGTTSNKWRNGSFSGTVTASNVRLSPPASRKLVLPLSAAYLQMDSTRSSGRVTIRSGGIAEFELLPLPDKAIVTGVEIEGFLNSNEGLSTGYIVDIGASVIGNTDLALPEVANPQISFNVSGTITGTGSDEVFIGDRGTDIVYVANVDHPSDYTGTVEKKGRIVCLDINPGIRIGDYVSINTPGWLHPYLRISATVAGSKASYNIRSVAIRYIIDQVW